MNQRLAQMYMESQRELYDILWEIWKRRVALSEHDAGYQVFVDPALNTRMRIALGIPEEETWTDNSSDISHL